MDGFASVMQQENARNTWQRNGNRHKGSGSTSYLNNVEKAFSDEYNTQPGQLLNGSMVQDENKRHCWKHKKANDSTSCFDEARALMQDELDFNNKYNHNETQNNYNHNSENNNNNINNNEDFGIANETDDTTSMATKAMKEVKKVHSKKESICIAFENVLANWEITDKNMIDDLTTTALRELEMTEKNNNNNNNDNNTQNMKNRERELEDKIMLLEKQIRKLENENELLHNSKIQWQKNFDEANYMINEQSEQLKYLQKQNEYLLQSKNQSVLYANKTIDEMRDLLIKAMLHNNSNNNNQ